MAGRRGRRGPETWVQCNGSPRWRGRVERRDPSAVRQPSRIAPWRCVTCRGLWTEWPSEQLGYCARCGSARP